jgi:hypothetical protein
MPQPRLARRPAPHPVAAFLRRVSPRVVDEDTPHHLCGDREEVAPAVEVHLALIDEAQVGLVHQRGGLEGVVGTLVPQLPCRDPAELQVDEGQELVACGRIAAAPVGQ